MLLRLRFCLPCQCKRASAFAGKVSELIRKAKAKNISLILIYRGAKGGSFSGEETYENFVEMSLKVENGVVTPRKNRFGGAGSMRVY